MLKKSQLFKLLYKYLSFESLFSGVFGLGLLTLFSKDSSILENIPLVSCYTILTFIMLTQFKKSLQSHVNGLMENSLKKESYVSHKIYLDASPIFKENFLKSTQSNNHHRDNFSTNISESLDNNSSMSFWDLYEKSSFGAAVIDQDLNIIKINNVLLKLLSIDGNKKFTSLKEVMNENEIEVIKFYLKETMEGEKTPQTELFLSKINKHILLFATEVTCGNAINYLLNILDTTSYKLLERDIIHSYKMREVGNLAGAIAHDFNNLLTAIMGFCDILLLKHTKGDPSYYELSQIDENLHRAASLVKQLLDFSKKETPQDMILNPNLAISKVLNLIKSFMSKNIQLRFLQAEELKNIIINPTNLERIIINLCLNSRDAMDNKGILEIETSNLTVDKNFNENLYIKPKDQDDIAAGEYVIIEVKDTGEGIAKEVIDKIFEPYFSTKDSKGTGLGLSIIYDLVKDAGGYIRLQTTKGKGTVFTIFFKAINSVIPSYTEVSNIILEKSQNLGLVLGDKILVVEDEKPIRSFNTQALTYKGYNVLEADCADVALDIMKIEGSEIKLIITDVMMPGMTGPKMIEEIKKAYPSVRVIYTSGYSEENLNTTRDNLGEREFYFLPKPYTLKELTSKIIEATS